MYRIGDMNFLAPYGHKCIIDCEVSPYDACGRANGRPPSTIYKPEVFKYIGTGYIYEISGTLQTGQSQAYHFYSYANN